MNERLILVGLEGATPGIIAPLVEQGVLPTLSRLVEEGVSGTLAATPPLVRSMTWTTLATGVHAPAHGVCADVEVRPDGAGVRPAGHATWRRRALWEWLEAAGIPCATIAWPASTPADSWTIHATVDEAFARPLGTAFETWPLLPGCVAPESLRATLRELRVHPADITGEQLVELVPRARDVDQDRDPHLARLAAMLARASTVHAAATHLASQDSWRFLAVCYPWLADVGREFMSFRAPRVPWIDAAQYALYEPVVDRAYAFQDAMLAALMAAAPDADVIVVSAYGFAHVADRLPDPARPLADSVRWHRSPGYIAARGTHVPRDVLVHGARTVDIAPTVLLRFGVAVPDLDGRAIEAIAPRVETRTPCLASLTPSDPGIVEDDGSDIVRATRRVAAAHAAEALLGQAHYARAAEAFEAVLAHAPQDDLARIRLASCRLAEGQLEEAITHAGEIIRAAPQLPWGHLIAGTAHAIAGRRDTAHPHLISAEVHARGLPNVSLRLGALYLVLGEWTRAESLFRDALARLPQAAEALDGLGCALHGQARYYDAEAAFRRALAQRYDHALAHLHLANTLASLRRWDEALASARRALTHDPHVPGGKPFAERVAARIARAAAERGQ